MKQFEDEDVGVSDRRLTLSNKPALRAESATNVTCQGGEKAMNWNRISWGLASAIAFWAGAIAPSVAQEEDPQPRENPLEITAPDPLLPNPPVPRPLRPLERYNLRQRLDEIDANAIAQWDAGNRDTAFELWYRELRLHRALDRRSEIVALGRVGEYAWDASRRFDLQIISDRLVAIQNELQARAEPVDPEIWEVLGAAFQQLRVPEQAAIAYESLLEQARTSQDSEAIDIYLPTVARLHLASFSYTEAARSYEELLDRARTKGDYIEQVDYLQQLAEIYRQADQPGNGIRTNQRLLDTYRERQQTDRLPSVLLDLADDYAASDRPNNASQTYQEAYRLAWSQNQLAIAARSLSQLAQLYLDYGQPEVALEIYAELIKVEQQTADVYGLMETYDRIGTIHLDRADYSRALDAFERGLRLARSLAYQEAYFRDRVQRVEQTLRENSPAID